MSNAYNDRGNVYFGRGDFDRAAADYDAATRADPRNPSPFANRALIFEKRKNLDRALQESSQAIALGPKIVYYIQRAEVYRLLGKPDLALQDSLVAVNREPWNAQALYQLAAAHSLLKNYDAAIQFVDQAINQKPDFVPAHGVRGYAYFYKGEYTTAIASFDRSIQLDPGYGYGFFWRARTYFEKKEYDKAIADFSSAIEHGFSIGESYENRGRTYFAKADLDSALADYNKALSFGPNAYAYNLRGLVLRKKGDLDGAIADFTAAIAVSPQFPIPYANRGLAYEAKRNTDAARKDYNTALGLAVTPEQEWGHSTAKARLAALNGSTPLATGPPPVIGSRPAPDSTKRTALVIGNNAYSAKALANPVKDARAMSSALRQIGFDVTEGFDLDYARMRLLLADFVSRAANAELIVVYYAGHGMQIEGHNFLAPIDAKVASVRAANFELFDLDQIVETIDDPAHTTIIILDACRNNPFENHLASGRGLDAGAGLAGYRGGSQGMMIAFAAAPGKVAEDGAGEHSPFTAALLQYITVPDLEILDVFRNVRQAVIKQTSGKQVPWENNSLVGEVYLAGHTVRSAK